MACAVFEDYLRTVCVEMGGEEILVFSDHCPAHTKQLINFRSTHYIISLPSQQMSSPTIHGSRHQVHEAVIQEEVDMLTALTAKTKIHQILSFLFWMACIF